MSKKALSARQGAPRFIFYEGPPTANGTPHNGHVLTRVMKDVIPRYRSMRGFDVPRRAGWDTHGLAVEIEVEKELRISGKDAIVEYGVEPFIKRCLDSVLRYTGDWKRLTEKLAFWLDFDEAYVTYHEEYVESVWWAISELFKRGLLYRGHKVVWWWAQGGTVLSAAEVGEGYRTVEDPSLYLRLPLVEKPGTSLLAWTTTPWTLPSNSLAAVKPDVPYAVVRDGEDRLIVAEALLPELEAKVGRELPVENTLPGQELVGQRYVPPFDWFSRNGEQDLWRVVPGDFVELDAGTGIVHIAPAFGELDFEILQKERIAKPDLPLQCAVRPDGSFDPAIADSAYAGRWVKEADRDLVRELKERGLCWHIEQIRHEYPYCVRSENDPLIQYARPAWYIRTTDHVDEALANNAAIRWLPEHIRDGRFGDFLRNNVDWALSRERFWGTPLSIWVNDVTGEMDAPASVSEILEHNPEAFDAFEAERLEDPSLSPNLRVHKPWIDQVTWEKEGEPGVYRRVPEVIDAWFDSGCMPFAQWGYPHKNRENFEASFPADFISEAIDQTRGWFNTLLWVSTLLFPEREAPHPYKSCIGPGPRRRSRREEGIEEQGQLHAARDHSRSRAPGVRRRLAGCRSAAGRRRLDRPRRLRGVGPARRFPRTSRSIETMRNPRSRGRSKSAPRTCPGASSTFLRRISRRSTSSPWLRADPSYPARYQASRTPTRSGSKIPIRRPRVQTPSAGSSTPPIHPGTRRATRCRAFARPSANCRSSFEASTPFSPSTRKSMVSIRRMQRASNSDALRPTEASWIAGSFPNSP